MTTAVAGRGNNSEQWTECVLQCYYCSAPVAKTHTVT